MQRKECLLLSDLFPVFLDEIPCVEVACKALADGADDQWEFLVLNDTSAQSSFENPVPNDGHEICQGQVGMTKKLICLMMTY